MAGGIHLCVKAHKTPGQLQYPTLLPTRLADYDKALSGLQNRRKHVRHCKWRTARMIRETNYQDVFASQHAENPMLRAVFLFSLTIIVPDCIHLVPPSY
jgi:hypothetical protein